MRAVPRAGLPWLLGGLVVAMAAGVAAEAWPARGDRVPGGDLASGALPAAAAPAPDAPPIDDWVDDALSRPLFAADRRPDAVALAPELGLPRLAGTISLADTALAMFQPVSADGHAKSVVVGKGATISGWTLTDVTSEGVTLARAGHVATLRLSYANLPVAPRHAGLASIRVLHDKRTSPFLQP